MAWRARAALVGPDGASGRARSGSLVTVMASGPPPAIQSSFNSPTRGTDNPSCSACLSQEEFTIHHLADHGDPAGGLGITRSLIIGDRLVMSGHRGRVGFIKGFGRLINLGPPGRDQHIRQALVLVHHVDLTG